MTTVDVDLVTGAGTIDVEGTAGAVTMNDTATAQAGTGDVRLVAGTDAAIGSLQTMSNVSIIAGSAIIDGGETNVDVISRVCGCAGTAIATNADAIETTVATLSAEAASGGIYLLETDGLTVTDVAASVQRVNADASLTQTDDAAQSDLSTLGADGDVILESTTGAVQLDDGTDADGDAVIAQGAGNVLIRALDGSITANADVRSTSGNLTILASQSVSLTADVDLVTGTAGTIDVEGTAGAVTMNDTSTAQAGTGDVRLVAGTDAAIGSLQTMSNVSIIAGSAIIDGGETNVDVIASGLRLYAHDGHRRGR